jgi:uncharacterized protein (DUF1499 family)
MPQEIDAIPARRSPNTALAVPAGWHRPDADLTSPVFPVPVERLRDALTALARRESRTTLRRQAPDGGRIEFEQVSRVFRFPDRITAWVVPLDGGRSTLALYSRARLGYLDFGVNARRVRRWLDALAAELGRAEAGPR